MTKSRNDALRQTFARHAVRRLLLLSLVVGSVLNLIAQGDLLVSGQGLNWWKILLTYVVPFAVASFGTYSALRHSQADLRLPATGETHISSGIEVSFDRARFNADIVHRMLSQSYWSPGIPLETVKFAIQNSLCAGAYAPDGTQVGFARLVTDRATFAYLCDVIVDEDWRGNGIGTLLVRTMMGQPFVAGLRRVMLATRDAHSVYEPFGFAAPSAPQSFMEIVRPDIYRQPDQGRSKA